jgi:ribonuclease PH
MVRGDGRRPDQIRPVRFTPGFIPHAEGSVLIEAGRTRVICTATIEESVPLFMRGSNKGWITSEYSMLPRATEKRTPREASLGRRSGRTQEIQRLIGRSLRAVTDLKRLGERTITIDCDVLVADAGTRCASITGGYVALALALRDLAERRSIDGDLLTDTVAAVSVGLVGGHALLDLSYEEDAGAEVDCNVVMTGSGRLVEIQGTAEGDPFARGDLDALLDLAEAGIKQLTQIQRDVLA